LLPAFFFWAVVPPCELLLPEPLCFPPREDEPGELAIRAARSLDIPLSFSASYCFSFLTLADLLGTGHLSIVGLTDDDAVPGWCRGTLVAVGEIREPGIGRRVSVTAWTCP
jgi:hypothetical protein